MIRRVLILAAHGSGIDSGVNAGICRIARGLEQETEFHKVLAAFYRGTPQLSAMPATLQVDDCVVVPFMTSAGHFATTVLPEQIASFDGQGMSIHVTSPVGTHPATVDLVAERIGELLSTFRLGKSKTAVLIAGHGTLRNAASREATVQLANSIARRRLCADVHFAFLDDEPLLKDALGRIDSGAVVVIPFMMAAGPHVCRDMPVALGLEPMRADCQPNVQHVAGRTIVYDQPVGCHPRIAEVVKELVLSAKARPALRQARMKRFRIGTRSSRLAMWQANHVAALLRSRGVAVDVRPIATSGDRKLDSAIADLESPAPFCDDIERALQSGEIDLAIHSQKDLALEEPQCLVIAAVLPRGDAREALVTRDGAVLSELPASAVVGTSSPRRAAQIRSLRPDLATAPIRGAVGDRVAQVRRGAFDAAVLAVAGLERIGMADAISERFAFEQFPPAAAQAAMVVQVRRDDRDAYRVASVLNHEPTRLATWIELELLRRIEDGGKETLSAIARVEQSVKVIARVISPAENHARDICVLSEDAETALAETIRQLGLRRCTATDVPMARSFFCEANR